MRGPAPPWPLPMMSQTSQGTQPIMTWNHEPKCPFVFVSWFSQVVVIVTQNKTTQQYFLSILLVWWGSLDTEYCGSRDYTSWNVFLSLNSPVQSGSNSWASNQTWSFLPRILLSQGMSLPVLSFCLQHSDEMLRTVASKGNYIICNLLLNILKMRTDVLRDFVLGKQWGEEEDVHEIIRNKSHASPSTVCYPFDKFWYILAPTLTKLSLHWPHTPYIFINFY
jgi:hypothetical protein